MNDNTVFFLNPYSLKVVEYFLMDITPHDFFHVISRELSRLSAGSNSKVLPIILTDQYWTICPSL